MELLSNNPLVIFSICMSLTETLTACIHILHKRTVGGVLEDIIRKSIR